ncbi:MAG: hypothetical protein KGY60_08120 [Bacteroidales bacterium]|nr:hypothetical protein [Bacteroidales bacterium]
MFQAQLRVAGKRLHGNPRIERYRTGVTGSDKHGIPVLSGQQLGVLPCQPYKSMAQAKKIDVKNHYLELRFPTGGNFHIKPFFTKKQTIMKEEKNSIPASMIPYG